MSELKLGSEWRCDLCGIHLTGLERPDTELFELRISVKTPERSTYGHYDICKACLPNENTAGQPKVSSKFFMDVWRFLNRYDRGPNERFPK